jgi:hypothetical protein
MQLEVGKYYKNRAGKIRGPIVERNIAAYPFSDGVEIYTGGGEFLVPSVVSDLDLIEEITPHPSTSPCYDDEGNVVYWEVCQDLPEETAINLNASAEFWMMENFPSTRKVDYVEMITSPDVDFQEPGYDGLRAILLDAYNQSAKGKGKERHATEGTPWHEQPMVADLHALGSMHASIFQARKKSLEACRLDYHRARCDLLGAIVYLAAAVRWLDDQEARQCAPE